MKKLKSKRENCETIWYTEKFEKTVMPIGNSAHVGVPKKHIGKIVTIIIKQEDKK